MTTSAPAAPSFALAPQGSPFECTTERSATDRTTELWQRYSVETAEPIIVQHSDAAWRLSHVRVSASGDVDLVLWKQRKAGGDHPRGVAIWIGRDDARAEFPEIVAMIEANVARIATPAS